MQNIAQHHGSLNPAKHFNSMVHLLRKSHVKVKKLNGQRWILQTSYLAIWHWATASSFPYTRLNQVCQKFYNWIIYTSLELNIWFYVCRDELQGPDGSVYKGDTWCHQEWQEFPSIHISVDSGNLRQFRHIPVYEDTFKVYSLLRSFRIVEEWFLMISNQFNSAGLRNQRKGTDRTITLKEILNEVHQIIVWSLS